jgi:hypothetical protein
MIHDFKVSGWVVNGPTLETIMVKDKPTELLSITIEKVDRNRKTGQTYKSQLTLVAWGQRATEMVGAANVGDYVVAEGFLKNVMQKGIERIMASLDDLQVVSNS